MKQISDMYFAGALLAYGTALKDVDKKDAKRQQFIFNDAVPYALIFDDDGITVVRKDRPTILQMELWYTSRKLFFPPTYPDALRSIKTYIHS